MTKPAAESGTPAKKGKSSWVTKGAAPSAARPEKKHGGLLHTLARIPGDTLRDLETAAINSPAGLYQAGRAVESDILHGRVTPVSANPFDLGRTQTYKKVVKPGVQGTKEDVRHPLRHPGFTALDLLGLASFGAGTAARGVAAAGKIGEGARASEVLGALATKPVGAPRVLRSQGLEVKLPASRSALTRSVQAQVDKLRERFPDAHIGIHDQPTRVGRALAKEREFEYKRQTQPFTVLRFRGRRIGPNSPQGRALRAVAEGTPLEDVIRTAERNLKDATTPLQKKQLRREIRIARAAQEHVKNEMLPGGVRVPRLVDPELRKLYDQTRYAALLEDRRIAEAGLLPEDVLREAIQKPQVFHGAVNRQAQFHVGQERYNKALAIKKPPTIGSANTVGIPRAPGRLTHALTGASIKKGGIRHDVPNLVAENALESERHAALLRAREFFIAHAQDTPEGLKKPVPIRLDELAGKPFPYPIKQIQNKYAAGRHLNGNETGALAVTYDTIRDRVFPKIEDVGFPDIEAADVPAVEGVKWIDERLLGGLNKPRPLASVMQHPGLRGATRFVDAVNNATKFSILYLKPAYAAPNMLGNSFLLLTHSGWAAPGNIGRAVRLARQIGPDNTALVDDLMGEGITASLAASGQGLITGATTKAAGFWSKIVDLPFRRAAFLYEARKAGYRTRGQIDRLLHDPGHADQLQEVSQRANRALIDYGDLTPVEQDIIRRVLFFYPWLKGSTKYAADYLKEHPQQAALLGQLGRIGKEQQERDLGQVPPFGEGLFKVGERDGMPLVANPTAAGILGQPADLAAIAQGLASGHVPRGRELSSLLTPVLGAGNVTLSGYDPFTGRPVEPNLRTLGTQLIAGQPILSLTDRLRHDQSQRMFPLERKDALLQYLLGTIAPRPVNVKKLNSMAERANEPRR